MVLDAADLTRVLGRWGCHDRQRQWNREGLDCLEKDKNLSIFLPVFPIPFKTKSKPRMKTLPGSCPLLCLIPISVPWPNIP